MHFLLFSFVKTNRIGLKKIWKLRFGSLGIGFWIRWVRLSMVFEHPWFLKCKLSKVGVVSVNIFQFSPILNHCPSFYFRLKSRGILIWVIDLVHLFLYEWDQIENDF